jgi:hypothetical protein
MQVPIPGNWLELHDSLPIATNKVLLHKNNKINETVL